MSKITTARDLRNEMITTMENLKSGKIDAKQAGEMNKCANMVLKTASVQLQYAKARKSKPEIGFLKCK